MLLTGFLLMGLGWENLAVQQPNMSTEYSETNEINWFLRFFVTNTIMLVIGVIQISIKHLFSLKIQTPIQDFTDLLPVANISIWITNVLDK